MENNMNLLFKKILSLEPPKLRLFFSLLSDSEESMVPIFISLISSLKAEEQDAIVERFKGIVNTEWLRSQINQAEVPNNHQKLINTNEIVKVLQVLPAKMRALNANTIRAKRQTLQYREILKAGWKLPVRTDQMNGVPVPPVQKSVEEGQLLIDLPEANPEILKTSNIFDCIKNRISRRKFTDKKLSLEELSMLLWATQGLKETLFDGRMTKRTVPSGGSRHPFETYLSINRVEGLKEGIYRYQVLSHQLVYLFDIEDRQKKVAEASLGQEFAGDCAVCFIWTTIPYRCEWRYMLESKKLILQDSGHLCQNLYLACEALNLGTCAIGAYDQDQFDHLLRLNTSEELTVYVAPVGHIG